MRYLISIKLSSGKHRIYPIDAENEEQAKERLLLRLPPSERDTLTITAIALDSKSIAPDEEPYGTFLND